MQTLQLKSEFEVQRLAKLLPPELSHSVQIHLLHDSPGLIRTQQQPQSRVVIEIATDPWMNLNVDQRNLLFWHELALIQRGTFSRQQWARLGIALGLSFSLLEGLAQNPFSLAIGITIAGFSSYHLYQGHWGEHSLRSKTAADQNAMQLALEEGYTREQAYNHLRSALKHLAQQSLNNRERKHYLIRLNVLDITAEKMKADHKN